MKKIFRILCMSFISVLLLSGCGKSNDELKLGFDDSFPPMGFKNDAGEYTGFDIDLAKKVSEKLNIKLKLQPINWDTKDAELDSGNIDCLWNGFTKTGRDGKYEFSSPYMNNRQVLVVKSDATIKGIKDLKGKKLVLQKESTALNALDAHKEIKDGLKELREVPENLTAMLEVETGNSDVALLDEVVAKYVIKTGNKKLKILNEALSDEEYVVAFKKGNKELADKIDKVLKEFQKDGTIKQVEEKYFGK